MNIDITIRVVTFDKFKRYSKLIRHENDQIFFWTTAYNTHMFLHLHAYVCSNKVHYNYVNR